MNAFINGALSALSKIYTWLDSIDPENQDEMILTFKQQVENYQNMYIAMDELRSAPSKTIVIESTDSDEPFKA